MPDRPQATTSISATASAQAAGVDLLTVIAPVKTNADGVPRLFSNIDALLTKHAYSEGAAYTALHINETGKPILFCGIPIETPGVIGRENTSGNSGSSISSLAAGADGVLGEHDGVLSVIRGGTVGTDQIILGLSLDGGRKTKTVKLGTANSYAIPYVEVTASFGAGTLVTGDIIHTWHGTGPRWDTAGLQLARAKLKAQKKLTRKWLVIGDLVTSDDADDVATEVNAYETADKRFTTARCSVRDRLPAAELAHVVAARMMGSPNITFLEVGGTGDTITRSAGSFIDDGFVAGDIITVSGAVVNSGANNVTGQIASLTDTVITLGATDIENEGPIAGVSIVAVAALTFAEVGGTGDTITRSRGSWLDDGFRDGDLVTVAGTTLNDFTAKLVTDVTATVLTLDTEDLDAEIIGADEVTITAGESKTDWVANLDGEFEDIDATKRVNLGAGRAFKLCPLTGFRHRRSPAWAASIREFQHDIQRTTWRNEDGPLSGWSLEDEDGQLVEFDERVDGGLLAARFTCFTTWPNGPDGPFICLDLTRDTEGSILQLDHNMNVTNLACTTCQASTEKAVGIDLVLNSDGKTATAESLAKIKSRVDGDLQRALLQSGKEGPRASEAVWTPATDDDFSVPNATLHGVLALVLNGTIVKVDTAVRVNSAA